MSSPPVRSSRSSAAALAAFLALSGPAAGCSPGPTAQPSVAASPTSLATTSSAPTASRLERVSSTPVQLGEQIDIDDLSGRILFDDFEDVRAMNADGSNVVVIAGDPTGPEFDGAWSPDGEVGGLPDWR